jgi:hypothetical protein
MTKRFTLALMFAAVISTADARGQGMQFLDFGPDRRQEAINREWSARMAAQMASHRALVKELRRKEELQKEIRDGKRTWRGGQWVLPEEAEELDRQMEQRLRHISKGPLYTQEEEQVAWDRVSKLTAEYIGNINGLNLSSQTLYMVLRDSNAEWEKAKLAGKETLKESISRTRRAIDRTHLAQKTIAEFREHVNAAESKRPELCEVLKALIDKTRRRIDQAEFDDTKEILFVKASELQAMQKSLSQNPVVLPPRIDVVTRYLNESLGTMKTALQTDELRAKLSTKDVWRPAMLLGMDAYIRFYGSWREEQLRQWQVTKMPKYYEAFRVEPPASIVEEARELARRPFRPSETVGSERP